MVEVYVLWQLLWYFPLIHLRSGIPLRKRRGTAACSRDLAVHPTETVGNRDEEEASCINDNPAVASSLPSSQSEYGIVSGAHGSVLRFFVR